MNAIRDTRFRILGFLSWRENQINESSGALRRGKHRLRQVKWANQSHLGGWKTGRANWWVHQACCIYDSGLARPTANKTGQLYLVE